MMADFAETIKELELLKSSLSRRINEKVKQTNALEEQLAAVDDKLQALKNGGTQE